MPKPRTIHEHSAVACVNGTTLHSIRSFYERHRGAWPSEAALRFLIRTKREELQIAGAILSPPGVHRLLIDEHRFFAWLRREIADSTIVELEVK